MKKILLFFILYSLFFILNSKFVNAASQNFATVIDATYNIDEEGTTHALYAIELTNKTTENFASSYKIKIGLFSLTNVKAKDQDGPLSPSVIKTDDGQTITVTFNKKAVGIGKSQKFTLSFDTRDIAENAGSLWEVNIPGLKDQKDFKNFQVHVRPPKSFGPLTYSKPQTTSEALDFSKESLNNGGISLAFGDIQYYSFSLSYHLENPKLFSSTKEITLPPSTNYQDVIIDSITPKPIQVKADNDGNWLAEYKLSPSEKITITVNGRIIVNLIPRKQVLTNEIRQEYTTQKQYWERNDSITKLAKQLQTPASIYMYVVNNLTYDITRLTDNNPRLGSIKVMDDPHSAVCLEFTDLFIALARAAGIPARAIDGFAYSQNSSQRPISLLKDILHTWPEYYDDKKQTWIMVDPTWGNTTKGIDYFNTFDFDHVAFVIKGIESASPIPPGGYKTRQFENEKDIHVSFTDPFELPPTTLNFHTTFAKNTIAGLSFNGTIYLSSDGGIPFPPQNITITSSEFFPKKQIISSGIIPPFGMVAIPIHFSPLHFLTNKKADITIQLQGNTLTNNVEIQPFFVTHPIFTGGILFVIFTIIIFTITTGTRRISFSR